MEDKLNIIEAKQECKRVPSASIFNSNLVT